MNDKFEWIQIIVKINSHFNKVSKLETSRHRDIARTTDTLALKKITFVGEQNCRPSVGAYIAFFLSALNFIRKNDIFPDATRIHSLISAMV